MTKFVSCQRLYLTVVISVRTFFRDINRMFCVTSTICVFVRHQADVRKCPLRVFESVCMQPLTLICSHMPWQTNYTLVLLTSENCHSTGTVLLSALFTIILLSGHQQLPVQTVPRRYES